MTDIRIENHGTLYLFHPQNDEAGEWLRTHVQDDAQWWAEALVVEPRYVMNLVEGAREAGLEVR